MKRIRKPRAPARPTRRQAGGQKVYLLSRTAVEAINGMHESLGTWKAVAEALGTDTNALNSLRSKRRGVGVEMLLKLTEALEMDAKTLVEDTPDKRHQERQDKADLRALRMLAQA